MSFKCQKGPIIIFSTEIAHLICGSNVRNWPRAIDPVTPFDPHILPWNQIKNYPRIEGRPFFPFGISALFRKFDFFKGTRRRASWPSTGGNFPLDFGRYMRKISKKKLTRHWAGKSRRFLISAGYLRILLLYLRTSSGLLFWLPFCALLPSFILLRVHRYICLSQIFLKARCQKNMKALLLLLLSNILWRYLRVLL